MQHLPFVTRHCHVTQQQQQQQQQQQTGLSFCVARRAQHDDDAGGSASAAGVCAGRTCVMGAADWRGRSDGQREEQYDKECGDDQQRVVRLLQVWRRGDNRVLLRAGLG